MSYTIGIDLGGSSVKAVVVTREGLLMADHNISFDTEKKMDWANKIKDLVQSLEKDQAGKADNIGMSAPGLAARDGRSIAIMPGRLEGLEGLQWTEFLESAQEVPVLNDGHAALMGEVWLGAGKGLSDVFMMTLGTGVGGGAMVDGRLLKGHIGRAGHLGHATLDMDGPPDVCLAPGSIEVLIGNCTIEERTEGRFKSTHELIKAHEEGDAFATQIWLRSVHALACAVNSSVNILDPEAVIIGGGIAQCGEVLFKPLQEKLDEIEWRPNDNRVTLLPARLGDLAGAYGAACNALQGDGPGI